jgi:PmbA protein
MALVKNSFDDEGVPCVTKNVVENGVFKGFMHTLKSANALGSKPTGNGFKAGGGAISSQPTNLYLQEGELTKDEIIATVEDGIYLTDVGGLHAGLNPISGDFNVQGTGFVIKNGKIDRPITLFVVSGNFYEMMNNVELIGNDIEKRFVGVACPTLKIKSLAISGK